MIVWFLISGKYRVRRYKDLSPQRRRKERNWIVKNMRERVYERQCVTRWQVTAKSQVSIGKWYIVVRTPLASIPREVVEWARVHLSCLSHSFRPDYIRVSTRVYVYTSAFAFTYWKNRFMHEFPSNWSYVFYCSPWAVRLSMHVTNSFCNLLLWKRFGCCYNRCMIFWLGNSEQIVRRIVSQYRQIVAISSINENFS